MDKTEKQQLEASIADAKDKLAKGLISEDAVSQLHRMIYYYEDKIQREYKGDN